METSTSFPLLAQRIISLFAYECLSLLRFLFGFVSEPEMFIGPAQLIMTRCKLRIQLDNVFKRQSSLWPFLPGSVELAEFKRRIRRVGLQLCCLLQCTKSLLLSAQATG